MLTITTQVRPNAPPREVAELVRCICEGIAEGCVSQMRNLPCLYKSGIRYAPEPGHGTGVEDFAQPWQTYARGEGDCDDLVIYRVSWLKSRGIRATVTVADFGGMGDQHVQVRLPDGTIEDPSVILGSGNEWPEDFLYDRE